jgi:hypothetical protein
MTDAESPERRVKIRFQGSGPLTRTTVGVEAVLPQEEAVNDALHWIWSWRLQVRRLRESFEAELRGGTPTERSRASSQFSFDEHILAVTGWNLARAVQRLEPMGPPVRLRADQTEALRLLRHLYEHWDEQRPAFRTANALKDKSAAALAEKFPQGRPWTIVFDKTDWLLGGILPINELTGALEELETALLAIDGRLGSCE